MTEESSEKLAGENKDEAQYKYYGSRFETFFQMENFEAALKDAEKMIEINAKSPMGFQLKAKALQELDREDEAEACIVHAISLSEQNPESVKTRPLFVLRCLVFVTFLGFLFSMKPNSKQFYFRSTVFIAGFINFYSLIVDLKLFSRRMNLKELLKVDRFHNFLICVIFLLYNSYFTLILLPLVLKEIEPFSKFILNGKYKNVLVRHEGVFYGYFVPVFYSIPGDFFKTLSSAEQWKSFQDFISSLSASAEVAGVFVFLLLLPFQKFTITNIGISVALLQIMRDKLGSNESTQKVVLRILTRLDMSNYLPFLEKQKEQD